MSDTSNIVCPFCGEGDFDLPGLAGHITRVDCGEVRDALDVLRADNERAVEIAHEVARRKRQEPKP